MSSRKSRRYKNSPTSHRTPRTKGPASTGEWEQLLEDPDLQMAYTRLSVTVQQAQARADAHAQTYGALAMKPEHIDLTEATRLLDQHPQLVRFLSAVQQREETRRTALSLSDMDIARAAPSMTNPHAMTGGSVASMGGWSGDKNKAQGVANPRMLREWADRSTWVRIAIMKLRSWCERADIAVAPDDESKPYNRKVQQQVEDLLDQPNEYRDSYRSFIGPVIEDILVLDRGCLWGKEPVLLADGTTRTIGDIVNQRAAVEVLAFNEQTGILEPKRVIGWHRNPLGGRAWVKVSHTHARNMGRHGHVACWFTDDHQLLTEHGWKAIKDIHADERVVTSFTAPNTKQAQLLDGMLLGDSSLEPHAGSQRSALRTTHGIKQQEWLATKYAALPCFECGKVSSSANGRLQRQSAWSHPWLEEQRARWYPTGQKIVPADIQLSDLTVATWYMDDGHLGVTKDPRGYCTYFAYLNTCGFSYEDQVRLAEILSVWGVDAHIQRCGEYWRIYITATGAKILFARIAPYILPSLRYKLPDNAADYDEASWALGKSVPYLDTISVTPGNPAGGKNFVPQTTFCLDVEDHHNFVASGLVAHNCIEKDMTLARQPVHMYYQDGAMIKIFPDWNGDPLMPRYLYDPGGGRSATVPLLNDEVICIMKNITTWRYGYSPVQYLQDTIEADIGAMRSGTALVKNKPPMTMVQLKNASGSQLEAVRAKYDAEFAGQREIMFIGGPDDMKVAPLVFSARDNQWLEWQVYLARKIATIFGISPQELGITFDVNRATAEVQYEDSQASGKIPLLLLLEEFLNRELLADFAPWGKNGKKNLNALNLRILYPEISEVARQVHSEKTNALATTGLAGLPSMTLNQLLAMRGEEPVEGGNTFWCMTTTGPMPWLSYDGKLGDYTPLSTGGTEGSQDAASGVEEAAADTSESTPAEEKAATEAATPPAPGGAASSTGASASPSPNASGAATGGSPASSSSKSAPPYQPPSRSSWRDTRRPGTYWSPANNRQTQKSERERKVSPTQAATQKRPKEEVAARSELADALRKVFGDVEERGSRAVRQYREGD